MNSPALANEMMELIIDTFMSSGESADHPLPSPVGSDCAEQRWSSYRLSGNDPAHGMPLDAQVRLAIVERFSQLQVRFKKKKKKNNNSNNNMVLPDAARWHCTTASH